MRIAIIGGGAAGMMCAATIQEEHPEAEVLLFEKNSSLGKKVIILEILVNMSLFRDQ